MPACLVSPLFLGRLIETLLLEGYGFAVERRCGLHLGHGKLVLLLVDLHRGLTGHRVAPVLRVERGAGLGDLVSHLEAAKVVLGGVGRLIWHGYPLFIGPVAAVAKVSSAHLETIDWLGIVIPRVVCSGFDARRSRPAVNHITARRP